VQSEEAQWEEIIPLDVEQGDLIWMECIPGGLCIFLGAAEEGQEPSDHYTVYHYKNGLLKMPDYYFISLDEACRLGYTVKTDEEEVPNDWETTPYGEQK